MCSANVTEASLQHFGAEVREWLKEHFPPSLKDRHSLMMMIDLSSVHDRDYNRWKQAMRERGWGTPTWPAQYGGGGLSREQARVLQQEMNRVGAWNPIGGLGVMMFGPTLLEYGSEEQKKRYIPGIASGEVRWCQGYSEPGAGSDLASLRTQCVDGGDHFIVNGQKIWTSGAQYADWCFCLVRTDNSRKHEGISFLMIDMKAAGVEVRPIKLISGNSPFCEVFFTDVRVPKDNLVGTLNGGWTIGKRLLQHERGGLSGGSQTRYSIDGSLDQIAKRYVGVDANGRIIDQDLRARITRHLMDARALGLTLMRAAAESKDPRGPGAITSIMKNAASRIGQERAELQIEIMGYQGLGWEGEGFLKDELEATRMWLGGKATTIYGGSYEIQNNIIARRILGLVDHLAPGERKMEPFAGDRSSALLSDEQRMVRESARSWLQDRAPVSAFRKVRNRGEADGFDRAAWAEMAEMGWAGMLIPEQYGGTGLGHQALGIVLEETGRTLSASPLISTALTATCALLQFGSAAQKQRYLPKIAQGSLIATLAVDETPHHRPGQIAFKAEKSGAGYVLNGRKMFVLDGMSADLIIVAARTCGAGDTSGITLLLVEGTPSGLTRERLKTIDSRGMANLTFNTVHVGAEAILGSAENAALALEQTLDRARAGLAAEMLGHATASFEVTLEYLKTRVQFDQPIGTFQALQHRAAKMFTDLELARSCVDATLQAIDQGAADVAQLASIAKTQVGDLVHLVSNEMVQMHGGIGMTDEHDAGLYLKRARAQEATFGGQSYHRERYATLLGY